MTADPAREAAVARLRPHLGGWPDDLLDPHRVAFVCRASSGVWYAVAPSARHARHLRESLLAFVGPSYSDFVGQAAEWDANDPVERELSALSPHGFRLTVHGSDLMRVTQLLSRLRRMTGERPAREWTEPQPLGHLLRDFELLLRAGGGPAAGELLDRLRDRGQLTPSQLAGLHLRWLAVQGRWAEVLASAELPVLLTQRVPLLVGEMVAAAVFHEHLARWVTEAEAVAHFREHLAPAFGLLFRQRAAWTHAGAVKAAAVAEAATRPVSPPPVSVDPLSAARDAHQHNDPAAALRLLLPGPFSADSLRLLVEVALDCGTVDAATSVMAAVRECPSAVREQAFAKRAAKALLDELEETARAADGPTDWLAWLTRAGEGAWPDAVAVAERGAREWPRPDPAAFNTALAAHIDTAFPFVRDALPQLLEVLLIDDTPDRRFGPSYRLLLERVVLDDELTPAVSAAVGELAGAVLRSDPVSGGSRNDYKEVVESLQLAWARLRRPDLLDWGLDLLELLAEHAVQRHAVVTQFVKDVAAEFARVPRRVTTGQRALHRALCEELDEPAAADLLPPSPETAVAADHAATLRSRLGKRRVVLFTLHVRTAAAFRQLMATHYPEAKVDVIQERAGSKRLQDSAANADVFIVNTFDASHADTGFVRAHRPADAVTLYPAGKNAARQLDALENWLRDTA